LRRDLGRKSPLAGGDDQRVNDVRLLRRNRQGDSPEVHVRDSVREFVPVAPPSSVLKSPASGPPPISNLT
jgi:hypothetical protein